MARIYETKYHSGDIIDDMILLYRDYSKSDVKRCVRYICRCKVCGREKSVATTNLTAKHGTTHQACSQGYAKKYPKLYYTWNASLMRIVNPNDRRYADYGGRGLTHDFPLFIDFVDYMLPSYLEIRDKYDSYNITLDRIDNNLGYIKGNIRWATQKEQANNRRTNKGIIVKNLKTKEERHYTSLIYCAKDLGLSLDELKSKIVSKIFSFDYEFIVY